MGHPKASHIVTSLTGVTEVTGARWQTRPIRWIRVGDEMLFGLFIVFVFGIRNKNEMLLITQNVDDGLRGKCLETLCGGTFGEITDERLECQRNK